MFKCPKIYFVSNAQDKIVYKGTDYLKAEKIYEKWAQINRDDPDPHKGVVVLGSLPQ